MKIGIRFPTAPPHICGVAFLPPTPFDGAADFVVEYISSTIYINKLMLTQSTINRLNAVLETITAARSLPSVTVQSYGLMTGSIFFPDPYTQGDADAVLNEFSKTDGIEKDGFMWLDEYLDEMGESVDDADSRTCLFDVDKSLCSFTPDEIKEHAESHLIPVHPEWIRPSATNLYLTLRFAMFDAIKAGKKTVECRDYTENYVRKILAAPNLKTVTFQRGYAPGAEKIVRQITQIELADSDGKTRYPPDQIPPMSSPEYILIHFS